MTDPRPFDPPSPFIVEWLPLVRRETTHAARALDVACGRGRHARLLAAAGFRTFAVDVQPQWVRDVTQQTAHDGMAIKGWCADLTVYRFRPASLDVIVVTRYLQRDLCANLADALRPGGFLLYETFTEAQRRHGRGPTSPEHLLAHEELPRLFAGLDVVFYEEAVAPDAVARLAARKRSNPS